MLTTEQLQKIMPQLPAAKRATLFLLQALLDLRPILRATREEPLQEALVELLATFDIHERDSSRWLQQLSVLIPAMRISK